MQLWNPFRRAPTRVYADPRFVAPTVEYPQEVYLRANWQQLLPAPVEAMPSAFLTLWTEGRPLLTLTGLAQRNAGLAFIEGEEVMR